MAPAPLALALALALAHAQTAPDSTSPISAPTFIASPPPAPNSTSFPSRNIPIIALSLAFTAFVIVCISVCCCSYRRNHRSCSSPASQTSPEAALAAARTELESDRRWAGFGTDSGLGLGLSLDKQHRRAEEEQLPAYEERPAIGLGPRRSLREGRDPLAPLAVPSPASSLLPSPVPSLLLSPASAIDENRRLLGDGLTPPPTPPPPAYAGSAFK